MSAPTNIGPETPLAISAGQTFTADITDLADDLTSCEPLREATQRLDEGDRDGSSALTRRTARPPWLLPA